MASYRILAYVCIYFVCCVPVAFTTKYTADWASLDNRPTPPWYDEAKFGIFIHWGVFSVPSFGRQVSWFWEYWKNQKLPQYINFMQKNYRPDFTYPDFGPMFTAEFFDPNRWADIFQASGAKYVVLTSKHHEGYTMWPSSLSWNWNSRDVGPKRDLVGDLAAAIRNRTDIRFGLYHSLYEWFNRLYLADKASGFKTQDFVRMKTLPELYELVKKYKPDVVWSDGEWEAPYTYWNATNFLAWLFNDSPVAETVATNDRWGKYTRLKHGGFYSGPDRFNPGHLLKHKWENGMTIDRVSWGFRRTMTIEDVLTVHDLLTELVSTVSCGGNLLMNIGPTHDGRIVPIFEDRLKEMGEWLGVNGEAIYGTKPWTHQNDTITPGVWYTSKGPTVYAITLSWPEGDSLLLGAPVSGHGTSVHLLGYPHEFGFKAGWKSGMDIVIPPIAVNKMPCKYAWVFRLDGLVGAVEKGSGVDDVLRFTRN